MDLVMPDLGLIFWQLLIFGVVFFVLKAKAWGPLVAGLKKREMEITGALQSAKAAEARLQETQKANESLIIEARKERDKVLHSAQELAKQIQAEAQAKAEAQANAIIAKAAAEVETQKAAAIAEIKNMVATFSIDVAEKVIRKKLSSDAEQTQLMEQYVADALHRNN